MPKKAIGIDIDGVLAASPSRWLQYASKKFGIKALKEDWTKYHFHEAFTAITREQTLEGWQEMWNDYKTIGLEDNGIPSIIDNLHDKFSISIITANPNPNIKAWLEENKVAYDSFFHTSEKHKVGEIDLFIDDFQEVIENAAKSGKQAIVLRQPYNDLFIKELERSNNPLIHVAYNWREIEDMLLAKFLSPSM